MAWEDERSDILDRIGLTEAEIKVLREDLYKHKEQLRQEITCTAGSIRQDLADEDRRLSAEIDGVKVEMSDTRREIERNSTRLGFVIAIGGFVAAGVMALVIGLLPYMMTGPDAEQDRVVVPFDQRAQLIIDIVRRMDTNNPDLWTSDQMPRTDIIERELSARLGYQVKVTESERDRAAVIAGVTK